MSSINNSFWKEPRYLSEKQVAEYFGISVKTLQRYRVLGGGPLFAKCGGRVLYDIKDCDLWVEKQKFGSTSEYAGQ